MAGMRLLALGVGNAFSSRYYSSCFALESGGQWLLLDCPHPIRKILREAAQTAGISLKLEHMSATVLTHLHADHASGVEGLLFYHRFVLKRKPTLIAHADVMDKLWSGHLSASMQDTLEAEDLPMIRHVPEEYYDWLELSERAELQIGPFSIRARKTLHNIPTTALKIRAEGRCFGFSADTAFDTGLIDWLSEADFILHEAGGGFLHTPYEMLLTLPDAVRSKMHIHHYPDRFDVAASAIEPVREGMVYQI